MFNRGETCTHGAPDDDLFQLGRECLWRRRNEESGWSKAQLSDGAPPGHYLALVVVFKYPALSLLCMRELLSGLSWWCSSSSSSSLTGLADNGTRCVLCGWARLSTCCTINFKKLLLNRIKQSYFPKTVNANETREIQTFKIHIPN